MKPLRARVYASSPWHWVLAALFAATCSLIQYVDVLHPAWRVVPGTPAPVTLRLPSAYFRITMLRNEFHYRPDLQEGCAALVPRGAVVEPNSECGGIVTAFETGRRPLGWARPLGSFTLFFMLALLLCRYMSREGMGRARWLRTQFAVLSLLALLMAVGKALLLFTPLPAPALPMAAAPLLAAVLLGRRLSFAMALSSAIVAGTLVHYDVQALFVFLASGVSATVAADTYKHRHRTVLAAGGLVALVALMAALLTTLLFAGTIDIYSSLETHWHPLHSIWLAALLGGVGSGLVSFVLLSPLRVAIGEASRSTLIDLLELNHPLLRQLQERAPSTWEHSRAMANLAEAAVHAVGGNALLVRVGAYFHDVGKSLHPEMFIENQQGGANPHDAMTPADSAKAIFAHVVDGVRLLRKEGVPEDVVEFAYTHHGTSVLEYFYTKALQADGSTARKDFCYPGHKPTTCETAILMIVDAVEAAARTVDNPSKDAFSNLVQRIVFTKMVQGQFDESGLSMHDLRVITITIVDTLVGMYHSRIKYPWQRQDDTTSMLVAAADARAAVNAATTTRKTPTPTPVPEPTASPQPSAPAAPAAAVPSSPDEAK